MVNPAIIRQSAEQRFAAELNTLTEHDQENVRPQGWLRSPRAVRQFILGNEKLGISRKFYGDDALVDRAIVTLLGKQGLMLVGEPGTAKSMLSELLAAAVSGDSGLTVQGTAGTTEDHLKYSWNYALLLAEGPSEKSLVASPVHQAMQQGKIVRFEEITRCPPEIQDVLVSLMSEKNMMIPELGQAGRVYAKAGFNIIATANLRDRGVHEMSSALKRRFNFETVRPIADAQFERELVLSQLQHELGDLSGQIQVADSVIELLVTVFQELRQGATKDGAAIKTPDAVMSTAEAVNIAHAAALEGYYLGDQSLSSAAIAKQLIGVVLKDNADDAKRMRFYMDNVARERAKQDAVWKAFFEEGKRFWQ
ncbi:MAG: AAA family ATPase [Acinetobacter sp.]